MHPLIVVTIVSSLSFTYLISQGLLPRIAAFTPELLALVAAAMVVVVGMQQRFRYVRGAYWLVLFGLALVVACGAAINQLEPGAMFAGMRTYVRALPFLLLPAVIQIRDRQLRLQLLILFAFCLLQVPLAWEQRMDTIARNSPTGDDTFGTLMNAKWLTLFQVSAASVLTGLFIRKFIPVKLFIPCLFALLIPTMINESKGSLILLPVALMTTFLIGADPRRRLKHSLVGVALVATFGAIFIPVYDHFMEPRWGEQSIVDFYTSEEALRGYLDRDIEFGETQRRAGKLEGYRVAIRDLADDPPALIFGLGIGNASSSALGSQFEGAHYSRYMPFLTNSLVSIILELGLAGLALVTALYWLIWSDTVKVAREAPGLIGALAVGWSGVVVVMFLGLIYHSPHESRAMSALFWYLSGVVIAHRMRLSLQQESPAPGARHGLAQAPLHLHPHSQVRRHQHRDSPGSLRRRPERPLEG
jgi:hypothetical protein